MQTSTTTIIITAYNKLLDRVYRYPRVLAALNHGWQNLVQDYAIAFEGDPAARNWWEVLLCYPGPQAVVIHRFAHWLHRLDIPFFPVFSPTSLAFSQE